MLRLAAPYLRLAFDTMIAVNCRCSWYLWVAYKAPAEGSLAYLGCNVTAFFLTL